MNRGIAHYVILTYLGFGLSAVAFAAAPPEIPKSASRSRLIVILPGKDSKARPVIALRRPTSTNLHNELNGSSQGLLARELVRQAILIAARDELGLATRDEVLGDEVLGGGDDVIEVVSSFRTDQGETRAFLLREKDGTPEVLLENGLVPSDPGLLDYPGKLLPVVESLSRKEFPAALKTLGLAGKPNAILADGTIPKTIEDRLKTLGFVEHIAAIRDLHEATRTAGESPAALAALARAYAQLGVLSEFQWHPAHKAFKARALLYAERLVARRPESPDALRHRAFVRALVGLPKLAREDIQEANRKAAGKKETVAPPGWEPLLQAFLGNETARLKGYQGDYKPLAALLRLVIMAYPSTGGLALQAAKETVAADPECYYAHEAMCRAGGVANLHTATTAGPTALDLMLPAKLKEVPTLPATVREAFGENGEVPLLKALDRASDPADDAGEPSWSVLAHLIRETRFVQVYRRLSFLRNQLGVPADEEWARARPFVAGHRFWPVLDFLGNPSPAGARALAGFADRLDYTDMETTALPMFGPIARVQPAAWGAALIFANAHIDRVVRDTALKLDTITNYGYVEFARALIDIDPRSTFAMAMLIQHDWDRVKDQVPAWEKQEGDVPVLLGALGKQYAALKQYDRAKEKLAAFIKRSPDAWAYKRMAEIERDQGNLDRWKATLDEYLAKGEDHGLDHARVRVEIANWFMDEKKWAEARPYADDAAETWAAWAMLCAARCHEGLKEWDEAETWLRRVTERYPGTGWDNWYRFCKRTGHGNVDEAREATLAFLDAVGDQVAGSDPRSVGYFYWSIGELEQARKVFEPLLKADPLEDSTYLNLALIADDLKDTHRRDELFEQIWTQLQGQAPRAAQICRAFREWLARGEKGSPDLASVDRTIARLKPERRGDLEFFVGRFLMKHGKPALGRPYLRRSVDSPTTSEWLRILALDAINPPRPRAKPKPKSKKPPAQTRKPDTRLGT